jgi:hypothetical protein
VDLDAEALADLLERGVVAAGEALQHEERVEQLGVTRLALDRTEPEVVVLHERHALGLHPRQQVADPLARVEPDADRHGVDEHPDRVLHAGHARRPLGDRHPEDHVVAPELAGQHEPPGSRQHGVERHALE